MEAWRLFFLTNTIGSLCRPISVFFAGKRFVPIATSFGAIGLGIILSFVWPPIQHIIDIFSHFAATGNPALAVTVYGFVERLLLPFGLHHVWNVPFFFEVGTYTNADGEVVRGILNRFFAGDREAGILAGGFAFKMFGLPAAALAMYHMAKPENQVKTASILISAALTSLLTGITEPLEFSFMFLAPMLYLLHAGLASAAYLVTYLLGVRLGYSFSHGLIDFLLFYAIDIKPWMMFIIGPVFAAIYYTVFRIAIRVFDLKTPVGKRLKVMSVKHVTWPPIPWLNSWYWHLAVNRIFKAWMPALHAFGSRLEI